jgi:hypothetical protein
MGAIAFWQMIGGNRVDVQFIELVLPSSGWKISGVSDFNNDGNADLL